MWRAVSAFVSVETGVWLQTSCLENGSNAESPLCQVEPGVNPSEVRTLVSGSVAGKGQSPHRRLPVDLQGEQEFDLEREAASWLTYRQHRKCPKSHQDNEGNQTNRGSQPHASVRMNGWGKKIDCSEEFVPGSPLFAAGRGQGRAHGAGSSQSDKVLSLEAKNG